MSMSQAPNIYDAEPIPESAKRDIDLLLGSGDLFRYTNPETAAVPALEREFAEMLGARFALAVSSCSAALFLSLRALNLKPGARVLIPAFTFAAVPSAVVHAGCQPVLVEVDDSYRINLDDFQAKLAKGVDAVLISHMRGHTSDMDVILAFAEERCIPVIEDAAHSLGTKWDGQNIGTMGAVGCFSFQSYKLLNAGEGGILVTDDAEIFARAVIMSGAYEHNWQSHPGVADHCAKWQNQLPLYNMRMQNLSATVVRSQLGEIERRVADGRANHDYVADALNKSPWLCVPPSQAKELRAPDSIQFSLEGFDEAETRRFMATAKSEGLPVSIFGLSTDNARAFWNWHFIGDIPDLPLTKAMLMRTCDVRLPARLTQTDLNYIIAALQRAVAAVKGKDRVAA